MIQIPRQAYGSGLRLVDWRIYVASIFGGVGDGKKEMLRKKTHVVRKKTHVVRKIFYVASIFGGVARRRNMPWELSSTPWELSSTAGDFSSTASRRRQRLQCVYRAPVFWGAHTSLPDTNNLQKNEARFCRRASFFLFCTIIIWQNARKTPEIGVKSGVSCTFSCT